MPGPASDRAAFRALFESYYPAVHRYFEKRGFSADEALDLAQETFLRAYRGWSSFRGEAQASTWVYRIAANTYYKELRRRGAEKRAAPEVSLSTPSSPELESLLESLSDERARDPLADTLRRERLGLLASAVAALPDQMRTCLELRIQRGYSNRQIAALLKISDQTVKAHLFQARKRLKAEVV